MLVHSVHTAAVASNKKRINVLRLTLWCVVTLGILIRLFHYFDNRSLWEDEIYLSSGIVQMSFRELVFNPLPYLQIAPIGYLLLSHTSTLLFGKYEMALRLYSLLTGIGSLFLFIPVAKKYLSSSGVIVALALLAFAPPLVYHAVEAKPYGSELFVTILILWAYTRYQYQENVKALLIVGILGSVAVWFAYSCIFVLAGVGLAMGIRYLRRGKWRMLFILAALCVLWLSSFGIIYLFFTKGSDDGWLISFFNKYNGFMPLTPLGSITWLVSKAISFFHYPLGLSWSNDWVEHTALERIIQRMTIIAVVVTGLGIAYFFKYNKNYLLLTACIFVVPVVASSLKLYPFQERMTVYLAPLAIIIIAGGCEYVLQGNTYARIAGVILTGLLLLGPIKNSVAKIEKPYLFGDYKKSYHREALHYVDMHYKAGDEVYIYWNELPGYSFYKSINFIHFTGILGKDYRHAAHNFDQYFAKIDNDLNALPVKKRVWVIYSGTDLPVGNYIGDPAWYYQHDDGIERLHHHLLQIGKVLDSYVPADGNPVSNNVNAYLLQLN